MDNKKIIFKLIQAALNNEVISFESIDEMDFFNLLFENGLIGLTFPSIDKTAIKDEKIYDKLKSVHASFMVKDIQQQHTILRIQETLNREAVDHIFLKGTQLKKMYPKSYMRGMGDIDVLVRKEDFEKAKVVFEKGGFQFLTLEAHHYVYETVDKVLIELHHQIDSYNDLDYKNLLDRVWRYIEPSDTHTHTLNPEFEFIHILIHLVRHIRTSGIGVRSILDILMYQTYQKLDLKKLNQLLESVNLTLFLEKVQRLNLIFTDQLTPNEKDLMTIDYLMKSGIHGKGIAHNQYLAKRTFHQTRKNKGKVRYFLSQVFPPYGYMKEKYPYLKKHPYLLLWSWMSRIFKQLFKPKNTQQRLKALSQAKTKEMESIESVFDYLGL